MLGAPPAYRWHDLIPALLENPVPIFPAVLYLAQEECVKASALEAVAPHPHEQHRDPGISESRKMLQRCKTRRLSAMAEALHRPNVFFIAAVMAALSSMNAFSLNSI